MEKGDRSAGCQAGQRDHHVFPLQGDVEGAQDIAPGVLLERRSERDSVAAVRAAILAEQEGRLQRAEQRFQVGHRPDRQRLAFRRLERERNRRPLRDIHLLPAVRLEHITVIEFHFFQRADHFFICERISIQADGSTRGY